MLIYLKVLTIMISLFGPMILFQPDMEYFSPAKRVFRKMVIISLSLWLASIFINFYFLTFRLALASLPLGLLLAAVLFLAKKMFRPKK